MVLLQVPPVHLLLRGKYFFFSFFSLNVWDGIEATAATVAGLGCGVKFLLGDAFDMCPEAQHDQYLFPEHQAIGDFRETLPGQYKKNVYGHFCLSLPPL